MADKIQTPSTLDELPLAFIKSMIGLATSGFGVVVALAWNQVIQKAVADYVDPYLGKNGGFVSLLIYAAIMTALAVIVTMQLTQIQRGLEILQERVRNRSRKTTTNKASKATPAEPVTRR